MSQARWKPNGGKAVEVAVAGPGLEVRPGGWLIARLPEGVGEGGRRVRISVHQTGKTLAVQAGGFCWQGDYQSPREISEERYSHGVGGGAGVDPGAEVGVAQFPGKVRKILALAGARLNEGDPILLVEAMKMEFAIKAPGAGRVKKVLVVEGQQLQPGDRFVDWEPLNGET